MAAADRDLADAAILRPIAYCFWLITRLTVGSRQDFLTTLRALGLDITGGSSAVSFIAHLTEFTRTQLSDDILPGHFTELASLSMRRVFTDLTTTQGSLFATSLDDLQEAFRSQSDPRGFSLLTQQYFGDLLSRTLRSYIDRDLPEHVGSGRAFAQVADARAFEQALDTYCRESARILRDFANDWYALRTFVRPRDISLQDARSFTAIAMGKLRKDLLLAVTA